MKRKKGRVRGGGAGGMREREMNDTISLFGILSVLRPVDRAKTRRSCLSPIQGVENFFSPPRHLKGHYCLGRTSMQRMH